MPRYKMTITDRVSPGHPRGWVPLPGGAKTFTKEPGDGETSSHEVTLSEAEADSLRRDGYEVVDLAAAAVKPPTRPTVPTIPDGGAA